jgi:GntR family transcriptional regulator
MNPNLLKLAMPKYFEHSPSPLYAQVADAMRQRIVKGIWAIDTQIPTLPALAADFGVGLITVRQAVQLLTSESLLAPKQGRGTFVLSKPETHPRMQVVTSETAC